ncbi:DnaJ domain protein [Aspergillus lucknowensis]|uniref:DnaJ domain-containing protein n=1 Tax=Aspergillus lucknowensis TaxID=176173 RepID=A0ABR4LTM4_9EURO
MPFLRNLRTSISQSLLDGPHCPHVLPDLPHHAHTTSSAPRCNRDRHGYNHTRKAPVSTTAPRQLASSREPTYYEILDVPVTATPSEIKKKFYSLSLRHHPDRNPNDPTASSRFAKISSAYQVLSNAAKRSTYDRDNGIHSFTSASTHSSANPGQNPMGSHSSHGHYHKAGGGASYFGSRPASGLSKRRGPFRGPPPSFYAHGGYGNRKAPAGGPGARGSPSSRSGAAGGASHEEDPTSFIYRNQVGHFNAPGHYRTQTAEDARRRERRSRGSNADINDQYIGSRGDFILRFVTVSGILVGAAALSGFGRFPSGAVDGLDKITKHSKARDG